MGQWQKGDHEKLVAYNTPNPYVEPMTTVALMELTLCFFPTSQFEDARLSWSSSFSDE